MLEPRRLAARAAAARMASTLGESIGETVGYRIRLDTQVGPKTRIEVVTEGVLLRLLQTDPTLADYGVVIFDEFHERSLHTDLGLALCLEVQRLVRPDLHLIIMSATLDCLAVADLLGKAPILSCEGQRFPVTTHYVDRPLSGPLDLAVTHAIKRALTQDSGSLLVFLPGLAEIRRVERRLQEIGLDPDVRITPLHGGLPQRQQDLAIAPPPVGQRKVVLATSIAETSLTIEGVRIVIDAGLLRIPRFAPGTGLTRLDTIRVTQDSAEQRRGRAGRLEPGTCYRLWTAAEHQTLLPRRPPEILDADLAPMVLELALWGTADPRELAWLNPPPVGTVAQARDLLTHLGALNTEGRITAHGRQMTALGLHPRLAHMILAALPHNLGPLACTVAALLGERDILSTASNSRNTDLRLRLDTLRHGAGGTHTDREAVHRIHQLAKYWQRQLHLPAWDGTFDHLGAVLAFAYPDRIAQRQAGEERRFLLANGRGAHFSLPDVLETEPYLVIAELDGASQWSRITLATPLNRADLESACREQITESDTVSWDNRTQAVLARRQRRLGAITLEDHPITHPNPETIKAGLLEGLREAGLGALPWTPEERQWQARIAWLYKIDGAGAGWPNVSDQTLLEQLEDWLGPFLDGLTRLDQVQRLNLLEPLQTLLPWNQQQQLHHLAPTHLTVPSGSRLRLDYSSGTQPVLAVKLQEMFGCRETPRVANGQVPVVLHLLSPAGRQIQVTADLAGFWAGSYFDVRKELRGRYPKHPWPDDPLTAPPTRQPKRSTGSI
jgi:ATP-dependent helicase HrpB